MRKTMTTKYTRINESVEARVHNMHLYVRLTGVRNGMMVAGEYAGRTYSMLYHMSLESAQIDEPNGISDLHRCVESGTMIRSGRLIQ
jgi:hypothetical protein